MARILVFNGSPKGKRSDTMHITRAFLRGMEQAAPQQIEEIRVIEKHIEYCTGCFTCARLTKIAPSQARCMPRMPRCAA